jgi:FkbM family methyltransferase
MKKIIIFFLDLFVYFNPKTEIGFDTKKIGTRYGGYNVYDKFLQKPVIISCGLGEDASFDAEMIDRYDAKIISIDPTPRSLEYYRALKSRFGKNGSKKYNESGKINPDVYDLSRVNYKNFLFEYKAISKTNGVKMELFFPLNEEHVSLSVNKKASTQKKFIATTTNLENIIKKFDIKEIDILKLDIEGAELEVLEDMLTKEIYPKQLLIEYDIRRKKNIQNKKVLSKIHSKLIIYYRLININEKGDFTYIKKNN